MRKRLAAGAALAVLIPCAPAAAAEPGEAQLQIGGPAAKQLRQAGVRVPSRVRLPVRSSQVGSTAELRLGGSLKLRKGKRSVSIENLRLTVRARSATLSAAVGGKRVTALSGRYPAARLQMDRSTGRLLLPATSLKLSSKAGRRIAHRLRLKRAAKGTLGKLAVGVPAQTAPGAPGAPGGPGTPGPGGGGGPAAPQDPLARLARPASAVPITSAALTWHARDSFIEYMSTGEGTSVSAGATNAAPRERCGGGESFVYDFGFPFAEGWYDPPSGKAALYFTGAVRFRFGAHGIDITTSQPEIEIAGAESRAIFRFQDADGDRRGLMAEIDRPGTPEPKACGPDPGPQNTANPEVTGTTHEWERMPGVVPQGANGSPFASFYPAGSPFGWFTVTFAAP